MDATTLLRHLLGLCTQPLCLSAIAAGLVKAVWGAELRRVGGLNLAARLFIGNLLVTLAGLAVFRHDGRMATDLAMVLLTAAVAGWSLARRG